MRHYSSNYKEADIVAAEKLTLQLIDKTTKNKSEGAKGLDYNWIFLCSYSRLFRIHSKLGDTVASQSDLKKIRSFYDPGEYSPEQIDNEIKKLHDFVNEIDVNNSVRWINE